MPIDGAWEYVEEGKDSLERWRLVLVRCKTLPDLLFREMWLLLLPSPASPLAPQLLWFGI